MEHGNCQETEGWREKSYFQVYLQAYKYNCITDFGSYEEI